MWCAQGSRRRRAPSPCSRSRCGCRARTHRRRLDAWRGERASFVPESRIAARCRPKLPSRQRGGISPCPWGSKTCPIPPLPSTAPGSGRSPENDSPMRRGVFAWSGSVTGPDWKTTFYLPARQNDMRFRFVPKTLSPQDPSRRANSALEPGYRGAAVEIHRPAAVLDQRNIRNVQLVRRPRRDLAVPRCRPLRNRPARLQDSRRTDRLLRGRTRATQTVLPSRQAVGRSAPDRARSDIATTPPERHPSADPELGAWPSRSRPSPVALGMNPEALSPPHRPPRVNPRSGAPPTEDDSSAPRERSPPFNAIGRA